MGLGCCDTPRGDTRQEYLSLIFIYAYHRPSSHTHYSISEPILTGPPGTSSSTRKVKKVYTGVHLTTRLGTPPFAQGLSDAKERRRDRSFTHKLTSTPASFACHITLAYHSSTVSPHLVVAIPVKSHRSRPISHLAVAQFFHPILRCFCAENTQRRRRRSSVSVQYLV